MSKEKSMAVQSTTTSWLSELVHVGLYKRSQGKVARQTTFGTLAVAFALAAWRLFESMKVDWNLAGVDGLLTIWPFSLISETAQNVILDVVEFLSPSFSLPLVLFAAGLWVSYRLVNVPRFADFLIAVEAEMNKVSWPSKDELIRSSIVVIMVIVLMSGLLYGYDALWTFLFSKNVLGILHEG